MDLIRLMESLATVAEEAEKGLPRHDVDGLVHGVLSRVANGVEGHIAQAVADAAGEDGLTPAAAGLLARAGFELIEEVV